MFTRATTPSRGTSIASIAYTKDICTFVLNHFTMKHYSEIITIESGKRSGKPCIRGMRITVYDILSYLASGMSKEEINDFLKRNCDVTLDEVRKSRTIH